MASDSCFKAYDIRGRVPEELDEELSYRIGRAYASLFRPSAVAIGHDIRLSSPGLSEALGRGLVDSGVDVSDIGLCGTEEVYFSAFSQPVGGGIMITASHNPIDYNGMKLVRDGARPVSGDSGLHEIRALACRINESAVPSSFAGISAEVKGKGRVSSLDIRPQYISHLLKYADTGKFRRYKVVVNAGNGCAGPVIDALEDLLPVEFVKVNHEPDGSFPNGIPNPLLPENRAATRDAVISSGADIGIAWDGDFDRCFMFDETGAFIEGYYIVGLLAASILQDNPGAKIIHDPRLTWNTIDLVTKAGGVPVQSKTGHAFIKERMRSENAVYGGEMSAHHYFRDFAYCDSGMIPWLKVLDLMSRSGRPLSELVNERISLFPSSGEINRRLESAGPAIEKVLGHYRSAAIHEDYTDGLSLEFENWRFNLRSSNTEPVVRLNVESRGDRALMEDKTTELLSLIESA